MKRLGNIIVTALMLFWPSLCLGVLVCLVSDSVRNFSQVDHNLNQIVMSIGAFAFFFGAGAMIFGIPGLIAAIGAATLLVSRFGRHPEIALFGSGLIGFFSFKVFFALGRLFLGSGGGQMFTNDSFIQLGCGLAAFGFGISALALSLLWPRGLMGSAENQVALVMRLKNGLLYRTIPALIIFLGIMVYYFHIHRI